MPTLKQATDLLAKTYGMSGDDLNKKRLELARMGMLPMATGRDIPQATPQRMAILFLALTGATPDRIIDLMDLRRFDQAPGDRDDKMTLGEVIAFSFKGLMEQPDVGLDMYLSATVAGDPWAVLTSGRNTIMQFGRGDSQGDLIQITSQISMAPMALFCQCARALHPPYKVP